MTFKYAKITAKFTVMAADGADAGEEPDEVPCDSGQVRFTPQVKRVQAFGRFITPQVVMADIATDGTLKINGASEVLLLDLGDENLTTHVPRTGTNSGAWKVDFLNVKAGGQSVSGLDPFFINPDADDNDQPSGQLDVNGDPVQLNDLSVLSPLPAPGGQSSIVRGPAGIDGRVQAIVAGTDNVTVDSTDPANPVISVSGGGATGTVSTVNGVAPDDGGGIILTKSDFSDLNAVDNTADANKHVASAATLTTGRSIALGGELSGSVTFDGSADVTIDATVEGGGTTGKALLAAATQANAWSALGTVPTANLPATIPDSADDIGAVPTSRQVAGQALSADISAATLTGALSAATESAKGTVELATTAEAAAGSDTTRAVTPAGVAAAVPAATTSAAGKVELATTAEATAGTDTTRAVTPAGLAAAIAATPSSDRVLFGSAWPGTRPVDGGKPLQWDDTAYAISAGANTDGPPSELIEPGDYWWTYTFEGA
jgi:hypothetical protein